MTTDLSLGLFGLTIAVFGASVWTYQRFGKRPYLQPVLIAIVSLSVLLVLTGISYDTYFEATRPLHFLLGPAITALAVPLYENLRKAKASLVPVFGTLLLSGCFVVAVALLLGQIFLLPHVLEISLATKSVTAPIALAVAEKIGGVVPVTILSVFTTGILGTVITPTLLRWIRVRDATIIGFTLGLTSHAFGIARSAELGSEAVAFATLGMTLMGCATAIAVPILYNLL